MGGAGTLDAVVVLVYLFLMVGMGVLLSRWLKGGRDYFAGGRSIPWAVSGVSIYMTNFSAWTFTGAAAMLYSTGWYGFLWMCLLPVGYAFAALVTAARWRRTRVISPVEYTRTRFGKDTQQALGWLYSAAYILACAVQLLAISRIMGALLDLNVRALIVFNGLVVLAYTFLGGVWAVAMTDVLQFVILFSVTAVIAPLSLGLVKGGLGGVVSSLPPLSFHHVIEGRLFDLHYLVALTISQCFGVAAGMGPRFYCVKDERSAKKAGYLAAGLFLLSPLLFGLPPLVARSLWPRPKALIAAEEAPVHAAPGTAIQDSGEMKTVRTGLASLAPEHPEEMAFIAVVLRVLPAGLLGLFLAAMFAATMSSLDSFYNITAAIVSRDIVKGLFLPKLDDKGTLRVGMAATMGIGLAVTGLALLYDLAGRNVFGIMVQILLLFQAPTSIPVALGLLFKVIPRRAGIFSIAWGFAAGFIAQIVLKWSLGPQTYMSLGTTLAVLASARFLQGEYKYTRHILYIRSIVTIGTFASLFYLGTMYQYQEWGIPDAAAFAPWRWYVMGLGSVVLGLSLIPFCRYMNQEDKRERALVERFFQRLATPVDPSREAPAARRYFGLSFGILGIASISLGLLVLLGALVLLFLDQVKHSSLPVFLAVASLQILLGGIMLFSARKALAKDRLEPPPSPGPGEVTGGEE